MSNNLFQKQLKVQFDTITLGIPCNLQIFPINVTIVTVVEKLILKANNMHFWTINL